MTKQKLILEYVFDHEASHPDKVYLTQPVGDGKVIDYTWGQTVDEARRMAAHLLASGLEPGARVGILSKNCAHFFMAELAIWMAGGTTVAIFPTETAETVRFVLEHSGASLLFLGKLDSWEDQASGVPSALPCIAMPLAPATGWPTWDGIIARSPPLSGRPQRLPGDLAMLIYTSGSTGQPKGVMHNFERITRASELMVAYLDRTIGEHVERRGLSYLPLAHALERAWIECASLVDGRFHLYFAESLDTFLQDLNRARPTVFISVPRLWLKFQQGVFVKIPARKLDRLLSIPILGRLVGRKILAGLGLDQIRLASSGSAPIPPALIAWYRRIGLNLLEGYAMTEDFAYSHCSTATFNLPGYVGVACDEVKVRISDAGEIEVKSPGQMVGYYKRPDLDAECFTGDGFFRTGDRGERRADGLLKVTGRTKELFKTSKGKYVAPAPIENLLNAHPLIEMAVVSGLGQSSPYAMVVLAESVRAQLPDAAVRQQADNELDALLAKVNLHLADHERLQMIVVAPEPWTIQNGCLTPTMKVRRSRIEALVEASVDGWYHTKATVQWV